MNKSLEKAVDFAIAGLFATWFWSDPDTDPDPTPRAEIKVVTPVGWSWRYNPS